MNNSTKEIADLLKARREELGFSKYRLSKISGITYPTIIRAEQGKKGINMQTFNKLANILGL